MDTPIIKYAKGYNPANTIFHAWHHAGGTTADPLASAANLTLEGVDTAHRLRDFPLSSLGWYVGYNFVIFAQPVPNGIGPWGNVIQTRAVGETTAAQVGFNFNGKVISICFLNRNYNRGNENPTQMELDAARWLNAQLPPLVLGNNKPHRFFGMTDCYGSQMPDGWITSVLQMETLSHPAPAPSLRDLQGKLGILQQILFLLQRIQALTHGAKLGLFGKAIEYDDPCHQ